MKIVGSGVVAPAVQWFLEIALRPKQDGRSAAFYTIVAADTVEQDFAQNRQRFLAEQGYSYEIIDAETI